MTFQTRRSRWPLAVALAATLGVGVAACGDDPFAFDWSDVPDTVLLYSLARPELNLVSAFSFFQGLPVRIEAASATGAWDMAVDTQGGDIVLLPPGALGVVGNAAISTLPGMRIEDVTEAPTDTLLYETDGPVAVTMGDVYVIRTNRSTGSFGSSCVYYAKIRPVDIDPAGGTLTFEFVTNPICNSIDLVPPD